MSTRANIIVKDQYGELIFYRHSDGYPEGAMPTLEKFLSYVKENRIRNNVEQACGWLILLGRQEYASTDYITKDYNADVPEKGRENDEWHSGGPNWKIGAIEPSTGIHGDIEYLYVIDLITLEIKIDGKNGYSYEGQFRPRSQGSPVPVVS